MIDKFSCTNLTIIFIIGTLFGSFLNVVIYRIPKSMSIIKPASFCPICFTHLKWYEKVPLISYILLLGKCSYCKSHISVQYPLIEIINGFMIISILYFTKDTLQFVIFTLSGMIFLCIIVIDFKNYIIPDVLIIISFVISLIYFAFYEQVEAVPRFYYALLAGTGMYVLRLVSSIFYKKETIGLGDIKLTVLIGFIIGSWDVYIAIFLGFILAAIMFIFLILFQIYKKNDILPLGPYLVFGMTIYLVYGKDIIL